MALEKMLRVTDICEHLGMSRCKAYNLVQSKGFPKIRIGHNYFIPEKAYEEWLVNNIKKTIIL